MIQSNEINHDIIINNVIFFWLTVSAPPAMGAMKESVRRPGLLVYTTTHLRRLQKAHFAQLLPLLAFEDRRYQEDAR